ncbi:MAG: SpoIIE family protein phosphatase [Desulfobacteraceae bacterium]|nr:SpoIIE family protein phosphatase [Desulfobacteraceae bacterium]
MLYSIQAKILFFITAIFLVTTGSTIFFTGKDVKKSVFENETKNTENIKNIIRINVEGKYKNLLLDKWDAVLNKKNQIKNESIIIEKTVNALYNPDLKNTQTVFNWIKNLEISSEIFIADKSNQIIFSTSKQNLNSNLENITDVKSRSLSKSINSKNSSFEKFCVFSWQKNESKKIGYFSRFENIGWILGVTADISEIEKETDEKINQILDVLRDNFSKIKIAESGSVFLFNSKNDILIYPSNINNEDLSVGLLNNLKDNLTKDSYKKIIINDETYSFYSSRIKALDWYISFFVPEKELKKPSLSLVKSLSLLISGIFITGMIILIFAVKKFSNPLKKLTQNLETIPEKDLTSPELISGLKNEFPINRKDEVGLLTKAFVFMFEELQKNIKLLVKTTADKQRIESELNVARDIQLGLLPKIFPPFPDKEEFDIYAYLKPAKEVGGDLYDFFFTDKNKLCFVIGDVSDKGVPAALFMAITKTLIKTNAEIENSPASIMVRVNEVLSKDNPNSMFVTLIVGILDIETGKIKYANAGHNPPIIKRKNEIFYKKGISGPVAGAVEDMSYREMEIELQKDDMIFLYTDGVTEAMNKEKKLFSEERLLGLIESENHGNCAAYIEKVNQDISDFTKNEPQSDDITMLSIIYRGN